MKFDKRIQGQSQLDYLWVNFGNVNVSSTLTNNPENTLLTQKAIQQFVNSGINDIKVITKDNNNYLDSYDSSGQLISSQLLPSGISIKSFGTRNITQTDIDKGTDLPLNTSVYSIVLTNGNEYLTPKDTYVGKDTSSIVLNILNNTISAELRLSSNPSIVSLENTDNGLRANLNLSDNSSIKFKEDTDGYEGGIVLENTDKFIKFCLISSEEYAALADNVNDTTVYFISGSNYFYFGKTKMISSGISEEYLNDKINNSIDNKLEQTLNWNNIQ